MTNVKAIETVYNDYKFRSRLEARWAVFFDTLGVKYEYEAQGYKTEAGDYLPDFWLPGQECWFEVKGVRPERGPELDKAYAKPRALAHESGIQVYVAAGSIKPGLADDIWSGRHYKYLDVNTLDGMLLPYWWSEESRIRYNPDGPWDGCWVQCKSCLDLRIAHFCSPDEDYNFTCCACDDEPKSYYLPETPDLLDAYITARQARFEHGETP